MDALECLVQESVKQAWEKATINLPRSYKNAFYHGKKSFRIEKVLFAILTTGYVKSLVCMTIYVQIFTVIWKHYWTLGKKEKLVHQNANQDEPGSITGCTVFLNHEKNESGQIMAKTSQKQTVWHCLLTEMIRVWYARCLMNRSITSQVIKATVSFLHYCSLTLAFYELFECQWVLSKL